MFVIGASSSLDFSLVGRVTLAEVIAFMFVPVFWLNKKESYTNGNFTKCLLILGLMFFGVIICDIINQNIFWFSARAFARPVFMLGFLLFFIPVLKRDPLSITWMIYGRIISGIINYYRPSEFQKEAAANADSYAGVVFRIEPLVGAVVVAFAVFLYPRSKLLSACSFLGGAVSVALLGGARSSMLIWLSGAMFIFLIWFFKSSNRGRIKLTQGRIFTMATVMVLALTSMFFIYTYAAPKGWLGEGQRAKYHDQAHSKFGATPWGFMLSGRAAVYGAILGIQDRPLQGFGSWRHDLTSDYTYDAVRIVGADAALLNRINKLGRAQGAGHSVFFQAWVENGVLLAIAYVCALIVLGKVFLHSIKYDNSLTPYIVSMTVGFCWAFFFSPPGLGLRFSVGFFMAFFVVYVDKRKPLSRISILD